MHLALIPGSPFPIAAGARDHRSAGQHIPEQRAAGDGEKGVVHHDILRTGIVLQFGVRGPHRLSDRVRKMKDKMALFPPNALDWTELPEHRADNQ